MWHASVPFDALCRQRRWKVEFFCEPGPQENGAAGEGRVRLGDLAAERGETVEPRSLGERTVNYIGLENVAPTTGELLGFAPRPAKSIKSRSKVFHKGDVLFGRLRPNLNKVWLAEGPVKSGICSTEFFVLRPAPGRVRPIVLRYLLSSRYVHDHAVRLQTGSALPRMSLEDLLEIEVPLPSLEKQRELEGRLNRQFEELVRLRRRLHELPAEIDRTFLRELRQAHRAEETAAPGRRFTPRRSASHRP